jgi:hypothetical protein
MLQCNIVWYFSLVFDHYFFLAEMHRYFGTQLNICKENYMFGFLKKLFGGDASTNQAAGVQIEQAPYKVPEPVRAVTVPVAPATVTKTPAVIKASAKKPAAKKSAAKKSAAKKSAVK